MFSQNAKNTNNIVVWSDKKFSLRSVESQNDNGTTRTKIFLERNIHNGVSADAVLVFARIRIDDEVYFILTRQWREATGQYCIDAPAGVCEPAVDKDAKDTGLRELQEETPLDATVVCESVIAYSSAGCTSETIQILVVDAKPKNDQVKFKDGIVTGPTKFDTGENITTLYVPANKLYENLRLLSEEGHAIDARLMTWALSSYVATMKI
ncbi:hypothetical protein LY76DRAFT_508068 [Colletotrichum caudatum]|nr:hypothetical protein LY76DRAFT_508068 [Colletotrichum caudatum]